MTEVAQEIGGLPLSSPHLTSVKAQDTTLRLSFLNLSNELKFTAKLRLGEPCWSLFIQ